MFRLQRIEVYSHWPVAEYPTTVWNMENTKAPASGWYPTSREFHAVCIRQWVQSGLYLIWYRLSDLSARGQHLILISIADIDKHCID